MSRWEIYDGICSCMTEIMAFQFGNSNDTVQITLKENCSNYQQGSLNYSSRFIWHTRTDAPSRLEGEKPESQIIISDLTLLNNNEGYDNIEDI